MNTKLASRLATLLRSRDTAHRLQGVELLLLMPSLADAVPMDRIEFPPGADMRAFPMPGVSMWRCAFREVRLPDEMAGTQLRGCTLQKMDLAGANPPVPA